VRTAYNRQTQSSLFFLLDRLGRSSCTRCRWLGLSFLDTPKLFCVCQDEIHMLEAFSNIRETSKRTYANLVKCQHLACHLTAIIERDSHPVVDLRLYQQL
jgi:hypothetical protein